MTEHDHATEAELRELALKGSREHATVLADFYEEHGQPSRAKLWRLFAPSARQCGVPDLLVPDAGPYGKRDPRRDAMIGLLARVIRAHVIARAFDLSPERVRQIISAQDERVRFNASFEIEKTRGPYNGMAATRRLIAAGALGTPGKAGASLLPYVFGDEPPATWPATRSHEIDRLAKRAKRKETP